MAELGFLHQDLDTFYSGSREIDPEGRRTRQDTAVVSVGYGLRERVNLGFFVPYRWSRSRMEGADVKGLGDLGISARFGLNDPDSASWVVTALAAVTFPTGEVETGFLDENISLGVGAISVGGGFEVLRDWPVAGRFLAQLVGVKPTGTSDEGVHFGGNLQLLAGYGRPFYRAGSARWAVSLSTTWAEPDTQESMDVPNRGGRLSYFSAGASLPLGREWQASLNVQRLLDADVHGEQLVARWNAVLSFRWLRERQAPLGSGTSPGHH